MYAVREAFAALRRAPVMAALSSAMVALALFVVGLFGIVAHNMHQALTRVEERVEVIVYIRDDARLAEVTLIEEDLLQLQEVAQVSYVSKEAALERAQEDIPEFREIFSGLEVNPLPASIEVELRPGFRDPASVARVAGLATLYPFVEDVVYGQDWVERVYLLRRVGAVGTMILGAGFAAVAALIIATAVRIAIFARREEILIMRLVGATNGFIRRPFLLEGFITGILGGGMAVGLTYAAYRAGYELVFPLEWIPSGWVGLGVLGGGVFGLVASAFAIRRHLREIGG